MSTQFAVIFVTPQHFGNSEGRFAKEAAEVEFTGSAKTYSFDSPRADAGSAVLMFEACGVDSRYNVMTINGKDISGGPRRATEVEWQGHISVIPEGTLKPDGPNSLYVESRSLSGESEGNLDDFLLANMVVMYGTGR